MWINYFIPTLILLGLGYNLGFGSNFGFPLFSDNDELFVTSDFSRSTSEGGVMKLFSASR